jgi:hypothetical protein
MWQLGTRSQHSHQPVADITATHAGWPLSHGHGCGCMAPVQVMPQKHAPISVLGDADGASAAAWRSRHSALSSSRNLLMVICPDVTRTEPVGCVYKHR